MDRRQALRFLGALSLVPVFGGVPQAEPRRLPPFTNRVGWAYTARPGRAAQDMVADLQRMRDLGANTLYIAHSNPGEVLDDADEPGMCPAVWYAVSRHSRLAGVATQRRQAVEDVLQASQAVGLDVILGIGYQIQMGDEWNALHTDELRRYADGGVMSHWNSGPTASPYSEIYRQDIETYYHWIDAEFVRRYSNIVGLNLADEPMGADYSLHAQAAFEQRTGVPFMAADAQAQGHFLAGVIADYAAWSAERWLAINPGVWTMMTFHVEREYPFLPDLERIFAQTPVTFVISEDTHLDDGAPDRQITDTAVRLLFGMVGTLGWLSRVYHRPLMLWTSANAWGLKETGTLADAVRNLAIVHDTAVDVQAQLGMLLAWGWNIRGQGIYDDEGHFAIDKDAMVARVASGLLDVRDHLTEGRGQPPGTVIHVPAAWLEQLIGERQFGHLADSVVDLSRVNFAADRAVYLTDGPALEVARGMGARIVDYQLDSCADPAIIRDPTAITCDQ